MSVCAAFCLLTSVVAFLISMMMSRETLVTFTIPALRNDWDLQQKAAACRNAGFMYLFIALALTAKSFFVQPQTREARAASYGADFSLNEVAPLVSGRSDDDVRSPAEVSGIPSGRQRGVYGSVEMTEVAPQ